MRVCTHYVCEFEALQAYGFSEDGKASAFGTRVKFLDRFGASFTRLLPSSRRSRLLKFPKVSRSSVESRQQRTKTFSNIIIPLTYIKQLIGPHM